MLLRKKGNQEELELTWSRQLLEHTEYDNSLGVNPPLIVIFTKYKYIKIMQH